MTKSGWALQLGLGSRNCQPLGSCLKGLRPQMPLSRFPAYAACHRHNQSLAEGED